MLGLAEQVGRDQARIGAGVGDDQQLARARRHVDRGAAGQRGDIGLGFGDPGIARARKSWRHAGMSPAPKARAAIAWAPPIVQIAVIPQMSAASAMTGSSPPSGRGGVTTTISPTPAARAGIASIIRVEKSGVLPPGT